MNNSPALTSSLGAHPASRSRERATRKDLTTQGVNSPTPLFDLLEQHDRSGLSGKMSGMFYQSTEDGISPPSSGKWMNSGMVSHGGYLTLNTSESPSDAEDCSLSDVLETGEQLEKYYLSQKACTGILRRTAKRKGQLPEYLKAAVEFTAMEGDPPPS